ncbi:MAG: DUF664 domain-containing protein [Planctomycetes bacterium]|nr:DUF664 domain-containing protein [Planctomycetota bacterium]
MLTTSHEVTAAATDAAAHCLDAGCETIRHCVEQLSPEKIWWRPHESMNSIGNLILHLAGNVRQWIVAGIGETADVRNRPAEFSQRGPIPSADLLQTPGATGILPTSATESLTF